MKSEKAIFLVNGVHTDTISASDRGLQFGDGVFETIRIHQGRLIWWKPHMDRLLRGCEQLSFTQLPDANKLREEADLLLAEYSKDNPDASGVMKVIITRGFSNSGYAPPAGITPNRILRLTAGNRHSSKGEQGIILGVCQQQLASRDALSGIKHLNRLEQVLARSECLETGWDEGIMLDDRGNVIEGSMSNIFIWRGNQLITPSLEKTGIKGLCRERIMAIAKENGYTVVESEMKLIDLKQGHSCDGIFVTNSLIGLWPVSQYNDRHFEICSNTRLLQNKLESSIC